MINNIFNQRLFSGLILLLTLACVKPQVVVVNKAADFEFQQLRHKKFIFNHLDKIESDSRAHDNIIKGFSSEAGLASNGSQLIFKKWAQEINPRAIYSTVRISDLLPKGVVLPHAKVNQFFTEADIQSLITGLLQSAANLEAEYWVVPTRLKIEYNIHGNALFPIIEYWPVAQLDIQVIDLKSRAIVWSGHCQARATALSDKADEINHLLEVMTKNLKKYD